MKIHIYKKISDAHKTGKIWKVLLSKLRYAISLVSCLKYCLYNPAVKTIVLHNPSYVEPEESDLKIVTRIFASYKKMKKNQKNVLEAYLPSSLWQARIEKSFSYLIEGLQEENINKFNYFLANFGTWKEYTGVENSTFIKKHMRTFLGRFYLQNKVFKNQLKIWRWFYGERQPVSRLHYPLHGNQAGAYINGTFVGVGSFFNEIYGSMLNNIVRDKARPVIADLGAGYGKIDYFILRDLKNFSFVDFDLPETLCLASYYLMKAFPNKKSLLYGEDTYTADAHNHYDLIFMPCWEIANIGPSVVDLFINKNSLGEMSSEAAKNYIAHITNSARYFFHMNHETIRNIFENGDMGLLGYEYPIPEDKFRLLFRYPDMGHLLYQGFLDLRMDIFVYLFERK